jgi:hypothetical protein
MLTLWGALNAVTEYVDHNKPAYSQNNRFKGSFSGAGRNLKLKAWNMAMKLVGKKLEKKEQDLTPTQYEQGVIGQ